MSAQNNSEFDALLDLSEYDGINYQSPALSPSMGSKASFASPVSTIETPAMNSSTNQTLTGPSHNYELYRQQTGFVPGALANTMAVNQTNNTGYQDFGSLDYLSTLSPENDIFDFNTAPSQNTLPTADLDMDFETTDSQLFATVNPSNIEQDHSSGSVSPSSQSSGNGRLWPGAHSQAALAKAQAQQRQLMQQRQTTPQNKVRGKSAQPADPMVERKITQLLNSMRAKPASSTSPDGSSGGNAPRSRKHEEDMDEDERLLASEEGKKLTSKERRQLRNKVSARAFRSRRKEYITQLEQERDNKDDELTRLRVNNRALLEENKRLSDLTRMLLSSPSFSNFLDHLSTNPTAVPTAPAPVKTEPEAEQREAPKDSNPYAASSQQQQIGFAMIPEQNMDFSMLALDNTAFNFQPQVFVVDTPELPAPIDASILSGKTSNFVELASEDEKCEMPTIEREAVKVETQPVDAALVDEEFEADPQFALFHAESTEAAAEPRLTKLFSGIQNQKMMPRYELVDATAAEADAELAMARVQLISANLESVTSRLELLTADL